MTSKMAPVITLVCVLIIFSVSKDARAVQQHCTGPIPPAGIVNVKSTPISPDAPDHVSEVKVTLHSDYNVRADIRLDVAPLPFSDDGSAIKVIRTEQTGLYDFTIITSDPVNSPIRLGFLAFLILTEHPCNTVAVWLPYYALEIMHEENILQFPVVSVMPERGYRVNKGEDITLKISVAYEDGKKTKPFPREIGGNGFAQMLQWSDDNELVLDFYAKNMPPSDSNSRLRYRDWTNSTDDGYLTTREMTNYRFDQSLPLDGVGVRVFEEFVIVGWGVHVSAFTNLQFTDESRVLPMNIGPFVFIFWGAAPPGIKLLGTTTLEGQKMVTVALDTKIPEHQRGLSCSAVGLHRAPTVVVSRIPSINDLTNQELVTVANPGFEIGPIGFGEFKVDLQPGGVMYYICTAYTGNKDVTSTIIKVIDFNNV